MKTWADLGIDLAGKRGVEVKTTCPRCSPTRKKSRYACLNCNTQEGIWFCWHCGWSGSLKTGDYSAPAIVKTYRKPAFVPPKALEDGGSGLPATVEAWFGERGITPAVLLRNRIDHGKAYFPQVEEERSAVMFPYYRAGMPTNIKFRSADKLFAMAAGCERILYGLDDIGESLVWVEGEIDKLSVEVAGYVSCVSVPDGAPAIEARNYENKFDFLDARELGAAKLHIIAVDNDGPGQKLATELIRRLGAERCRVVDWPEGCKDANDTLVKHGASMVAACIDGARDLPIIGAHDLMQFHDQVAQIYSQGVPRGVSTGWHALDTLFRVRPGDVTVVTGAPNSGKSEWLDALVINLAQAFGWRIGLYSPEQGSPAEHIAKLAEKFIGKPFNIGPTPRMTRAELDTAEAWLNEHFTWVEPETPTLDALLAVADQLILRKGALGLVLDPWNEIEHARPRDVSETEYIGICLRQIRRFARAHQVHVWIVAHPTKLMKDPKTMQYPVATAYDISGSANWNNKADAVISVWRDRDPEKRTTAVEIHVQKIRSKYVGSLGMATLNWDRATGRYSDTDKAPF